MERKTRVGVALAAVLLGAAGARADETTYCNQYITTLPYVITVQGHYCFNRNLSTAITGGAAITVAANFVVLDLNNFKLGGGSAGLGTQAVGVLAQDRQNITVRNGNIRGFRTAIALEGTAGAGHVIENMLLDFNTVGGAFSAGAGTVMRNNIVVASGGSTVYPAFAYGLALFNVPGLVEDNFVNEVTAAGDAFAVYAGNYGIAQRNSVFFEPYDPADSVGVLAVICRDNNVVAADYPAFCGTESGTLAYPPPIPLSGGGRDGAARGERPRFRR